VAPTTRQEETAVQRAEERTDDRVLPPRARAEEATS
jgi:hypothetical protein